MAVEKTIKHYPGFRAVRKFLCDNRSCFSIDYHNVLDVHRTSWRSATRYWDSVGEPCVNAIQKLAVYFNTIVCSYCHSDFRVNRAIEACQNKLVHPNKQLNPKLVVVTRHPVGEYGKLAVLQALIDPGNSVSFHVDDGVHILQEFVTAGRQWSCIAIRHRKHLEIPRQVSTVCWNLAEVASRAYAEVEAIRDNPEE